MYVPQREPVEWWSVIAWVLILTACLTFWAGVGFGANIAWHSLFGHGHPPKPDRAPVVHRPTPDAAHVVCVESKPRPHIGTAIYCTSA